MCLYPKYLDIPNKRPTLAQSYSRIHSVVPCGKCVECLKQRQSSFATRIYLESRKCDKMFFVTFTYNDAYLPLAMRVERVHKDTGVIDELSRSLERYKREYSEGVSEGITFTNAAQRCK